MGIAVEDVITINGFRLMNTRGRRWIAPPTHQITTEQNADRMSVSARHPAGVKPPINMFTTPVCSLIAELALAPSERRFHLRDATGALVREITKREAEVLLEPGFVEGVSSRRGLRYLRLTCEPKKAHALLSRSIHATGRTIAESCQLVSRRNVPGGGVLFEHHMGRCRAYAPETRRNTR